MSSILAWKFYHVPIEDRFVVRVMTVLTKQSNFFALRFRICSQYRMKMANRASQLFYDLGNTGTSTFFAFKSMTISLPCPASHALVKRLILESKALERSQLRHPEPSFVDRWDVTQPTLQLRGAWRKLKVGGSSSVCPSKRHNFGSWIWRSRLYVCGGMHGKIKYQGETNANHPG